jgi:hypothetical protein
MVRNLAKQGLIGFSRAGEEFTMGVAGLGKGEIAARMKLAESFATGGKTKLFDRMLGGGSINRLGTSPSSIPGGAGLPGGGTVGGASGVDFGAGAGAGSTALVKWKPPAYRAREIVAGATPGGQSGYMGSSIMGGLLGYSFADDDQKGWGTFMGVVGGGIGGKAFRTFSQRGAGFSNSIYTGMESKLASGNWGALSRGWNSQKHVVHKGLRGFHSAEGRNNMFRSGAMLGGGAFGVMFASNGRSHKRGFNQNRGNSFTR